MWKLSAVFGLFMVVCWRPSLGERFSIVPCFFLMGQDTDAQLDKNKLTRWHLIESSSPSHSLFVPVRLVGRDQLDYIVVQSSLGLRIGLASCYSPDPVPGGSSTLHGPPAHCPFPCRCQTCVRPRCAASCAPTERPSGSLAPTRPRASVGRAPRRAVAGRGTV